MRQKTDALTCLDATGLSSSSDHLYAMNRHVNPYTAPRDENPSVAGSSAVWKFPVRSVVAGLLAMATLGTGILLVWLSHAGTIDLGQLGPAALASLLVAAVALFASVRNYMIGSRRYAVTFLCVAMLFFILIVLIALQESGVITWLRMPIIKP